MTLTFLAASRIKEHNIQYKTSTALGVCGGVSQVAFVPISGESPYLHSIISRHLSGCVKFSIAGAAILNEIEEGLQVLKRQMGIQVVRAR